MLIQRIERLSDRNPGPSIRPKYELHNPKKFDSFCFNESNYSALIPFHIDIIAKRIRLVEHSMGWAKMTTVVFDTELWGQICKIESFKCKRSDSGSQKCLINTRMDSPECWSYDHSMSWSFYRLNKHLVWGQVAFLGEGFRALVAAEGDSLMLHISFHFKELIDKIFSSLPFWKLKLKDFWLTT